MINLAQAGKLHARLQSIRSKLVSDLAGASSSEALSNLDDTLNWLVALIEAEGREPKFAYDASREVLRFPLRNEFDFTGRSNFVIGNRRSGTTLLMYLLDASESICALPENMLAGEFSSSDKLIKSGHLVMPSFNRHGDIFSLSLGKLIDSIYLEFCQSQGKGRWVSKELFIAHRLDRLDALFNYQSKFVYMVRHGLDVAYSCAKRFPGRLGPQVDSKSSLNVEVHLNEWIVNNELTMDFYERNADRCLLVKYEDLTLEPERIAQEIYSFFGEPWDKDILSKMERLDSRHMMGDQNIHARGKRILPSNKWSDEWPSNFRSVMARRANATLTRLGYEPVT